MPTENRSSNTEMVSVPRAAAELAKQALEDDDHFSLADELAKALACPAPQPHPDPIAWMVGTAFWWTKEEAERDAAETGKTIAPIGPMTGNGYRAEQRQGEPAAIVAIGANDTAVIEFLSHDLKVGTELYTRADPGEVEQLRTELVEWKDRCQRNNDDAMEWMAKHDTLRAQMAERDALMRDSSGKLVQMAAHLIGAPLRGLHDLQDEDKRMTRPRVDSAVDFADARLKDAAYEIRRIANALSASAELNAPAHDPKLIGIMHTPPAEYDEP